MTCPLRTRALSAASLIALLGLVVSIPSASATLIVSGSGTSAEGNPLAASAEFTIAGDTLTLRLVNTSPVESKEAADVLSSFYFDVINGDGFRPELAFTDFNQNGYVWLVRKSSDRPYNYTPPSDVDNYEWATGGIPHVAADLRAFNNNDRTWQLRAMDPSLPPYEGFGIGTVGNSGFSPNGFDPFIVGAFPTPGNQQIAFGIYRDLDGDIDPEGQLTDKFLVRNEATFVFSGLTGYTEADIVPAVFGFGTGPDSTIVVPEPGTGGLVVAALAAAGGLLGWRRHRKTFLVGMAAAGILAVAVVAMPAATATPIVVDNAFDFTAGGQGWTPQPVGIFVPPPVSKQWRHENGQWSVRWSPVNGPLVANGNYLTSPVMTAVGQVAGPVDLIRISLAHQFDFGSSINGIPPAAGQLAYSINGSAFEPVPLAAFRSGLLSDTQPPFTPPLEPMPASMVDQLGLVQPTFVPPAGGYSSLLPLINDGAAFIGTSPGFGSQESWFVPSIAILDIPPIQIESFHLRLINANLGSNCDAGGSWDVRYAQVDFAAPEPGGMTLAGCGGVVAAVSASLARQRRLLARGQCGPGAPAGYQRPSKPSVSPWA